jgi:lysophospholipase L1-like esterase
MTRLALSVAAATVCIFASSPAARAVEPKIEGETAWYNAADWGVEGKGWRETARYYDRLPAKAEGVVPAPVWSLSRHSAGMCVRFETDASAISARYTLSSDNVAMPHMPATGVSGVDLYAQAEDGHWGWVGVSRPTAKEVKAELATGLLPGCRAYMIYLPLYNGVESLEIGVPAKAAFKPLPPRTEKPIVYYGTSIAHGACASRPGMSFSAILGRRLDRPVINLAFSGNGRMDPEVGDLLAELDPAVYVIDCLPNMEAQSIAERTEPLIRKLRAARPDAPIVMVEDRTYANTPFLPSRRERHTTSRAAFKKACENLVAAGVKGLHYVEGENLLGADGEATTDSSHPSDLGMMRMAESLLPVLEPLVGGK